MSKHIFYELFIPYAAPAVAAAVASWFECGDIYLKDYVLTNPSLDAALATELWNPVSKTAQINAAKGIAVHFRKLKEVR